ncbi:MAG: beta-L-arabinofuranosidase domain-containing protein [Parabacteroides sp.]
MKHISSITFMASLQLLAMQPVFALSSPVTPTVLTHPAPAEEAGRHIRTVAPIRIQCPQGTVPRLPYQVWVTYSDGQSEYRQTRWSNAALITEQTEADSQSHPAGSSYTVEGFVIGDETTENGFPIQATVEVVATPYAVPTQPIAHTIPLTDVTIDGNNRLTSNRDMAIREIISWDVTQQLYNYRDTYGFSTEGYTRSDGWDSPDTKLKGHGSGHYMSALALAYAAATDPSQKAALKERIQRMVDELRVCQERTFVWNEELGRYWEARDFAPEAELKEMKGTWEAFDEHKKEWAKYGYGYLNAIPAHHPALIEMYRAYNNSDWVWAPYYSIHKQLAGLIEIATYMDDKAIAEKALLIAKDMGLWVWNRMHYRTFVQETGTQDERRARPGNRYEMWNMYIAGEVGGISESLARLSEMVSDPEEKAHLLEASNCFDSPAFFQPLSKNIDDIRTRHANQHIPMIIGALRSYLSNHDAFYYNLSENFWNLIQGRYRYATGGVGNGEMFRQPYTQILSMATNGVSEGDTHANPEINETCCAYNLLKLTKDLNCLNPDDARYMDYYERTLFNQIVGSLNPDHYETTYQYAVGLNASKPWGNETPQSTCCGGTGSENHVKYQEATYFASDDALWVALYMPTTLHWKEKGITLQQECLWPAEQSTLRITEGSAEFALKLRVPYWATEGFEVKVNGTPTGENYQPCSYAVLPARTWKAGDVIEITMPFTKHIDYGPDKLPAEIASQDGENLPAAWVGTLMYGPLVMTATDVSNWKEATLNVDSHLATITNVEPSGMRSGTNGNLYILTQGGRTFQPDYYRHDHSTHYFRINHVSDPTTELKMALQEKLREAQAFQKKNYSKKSYANLQAAVQKGTQLIAATSVSEVEIAAGTTAIDEAAKALVATRLDKSLLTATIRQAAAQAAETYTTDSYQALQIALESARDVEHNSDSQFVVDKQTLALQDAIGNLVTAASVDKKSLQELIAEATTRKNDQEKWNALTVKVPEYAPWAQYGYMRLTESMEQAQRVLGNQGKNYSQGEVNATAAALNAAINTMRPGNLPEMEDLRPLSGLLRRAGKLTESSSPELKEAVEYAQMVMKYVTDGSGTHDMITEAVKRLRKATGQE